MATITVTNLDDVRIEEIGARAVTISAETILALHDTWQRARRESGLSPATHPIDTVGRDWSQEAEAAEMDASSRMKAEFKRRGIPEPLIKAARNNAIVHAYLDHWMADRMPWDEAMESCVASLAEHCAKLLQALISVHGYAEIPRPAIDPDRDKEAERVRSANGFGRTPP